MVPILWESMTQTNAHVYSHLFNEISRPINSTAQGKNIEETKKNALCFSGLIRVYFDTIIAKISEWHRKIMEII